MKKIVEVTDACGLDSLLGEKVLLICSVYFYTGKLTGVNESFVELEGPAIVYETGAWSSKSYQNVEQLHANKFYVQRNAIESFGVAK